MDRTMVWKAEEREAGEKLYNKLDGLTTVYPASETMRSLLSDRMFLKPNPPAFFHVMHYLFWLLDPSEFRKRFFWPLTDKRSEASFRSATVEYLKFLSEKHQFQWSTSIKSYLVVMPGGMKFITFMLEFVGFVVQEMVQIREKQLVSLLNIDSTVVMDVSQSNLLRMRNQNRFLKEFAGSYCEEMETQIDVLRKRTRKINQQMLKMAEAIDMKLGSEHDDETSTFSDTFLDDFEQSNCDLMRSKFIEPAARIRSREMPLMKLKQSLESFTKMEKDLHYDRDQVKEVIGKLRESHPTQMPPASTGPNVNLHTLLAAFNCTSDAIENALTDGEHQFQNIAVFKENRLAEKIKLDKAMSIVTTIQQELNNSIKMDIEKRGLKTPLRSQGNALSTANGSTLFNSLLEKIIYTPPITLNMQRSDFPGNRLALLENSSAKMLDQPLNSFLGTAPNSVRKLKSALKANNSNQSYDANTTVNRTGIIDAMQLLRTIKKDGTIRSKANTSNNTFSQKNLSRLGEKWNERQYLINDSVVEKHNLMAMALTPQRKPTITVTPPSPSHVTSPFTPFNGGNENTRIARQQRLELSMSETKDIIMVNSPIASASQPVLDKQSLAIRKVRDDSLNMLNLSTSPSGRLGALVSDVDLSKMQINDEVPFDNNIGEAVELLQQAMNTLQFATDINVDNIENNANLPNQIQPRSNLFSDLIDEDDVLANISDSILKDIPM